MTSSKRIFLVIAVLFTAAMGWFAYDLMSRTTPRWGRKGQLRERIEKKLETRDSTQRDSVRSQ